MCIIYTPCYSSSVLLFRMNLNIHAQKKEISLSLFLSKESRIFEFRPRLIFPDFFQIFKHQIKHPLSIQTYLNIWQPLRSIFQAKLSPPSSKTKHVSFDNLLER